MSDHADVPEIGHTMSPSQLSQLWHFDMLMANVILRLPLRKCSSIPGDSNSPEMDSKSFQDLKSRIAHMWINASHLFECRKTDEHGWGLFVSDNYNKTERTLTVGKSLPLGWVARVPGPGDPTYHRYLRSPCIRGTNTSLYLGGPISLATYDEIDMVFCRFSISREKHLANTLLVSKAPKRKFNPGAEVMWTYNIPLKNRKMEVIFYQETEWKLKCCSEEDDSALDKQSKRCRQPCEKRSLGLKSFRPCTFCGQNLAEATKPKINTKCHLALKHAVDLCSELPGYKSEIDLVSPKEFMQHLDLVVNVLNLLNSMNYKIVPACQFFKITGTPMPHPDAPQKEKDLVFRAFQEEGKKAFERYQVLYLKGIRKPTSYEDLMVSSRITTYSDINWIGDRPSTTILSLSPYCLTKEEEDAHSRYIKDSVVQAILLWQHD
ncbi:Immunoglobulin superfamily member 10 [Frankliniella fusca]|uniref:Immunoglobulin superfamily member 10 n=1 Tax=Frankliniella fusca TaxID=407009 RepID=A0AAE1HGH7_9NEOP|nr:Immunoglobulin superfamily member 10 [Frankliniella fusca]